MPAAARTEDASAEAAAAGTTEGVSPNSGKPPGVVKPTKGALPKGVGEGAVADKSFKETYQGVYRSIRQQCLFSFNYV